MKKSLSIALTSIYILATAGIMVNVHFCCGGLADISLWSDLDPCSCSHHDHDCEGEKNCCAFDSLYLNVDVDHNAPMGIVLPNLMAVSAPTVNVTAKETLADNTDAPSRDLRGPPESGIPIYLASCSLVYYG